VGSITNVGSGVAAGMLGPLTRLGAVSRLTLCSFVRHQLSTSHPPMPTPPLRSHRSPNLCRPPPRSRPSPLPPRSRWAVAPRPPPTCLAPCRPANLKRTCARLRLDITSHALMDYFPVSSALSVSVHSGGSDLQKLIGMMSELRLAFKRETEARRQQEKQVYHPS
jgi:hypothetical protein